MRMFPIDVEIKLSVCARDFDEALAAVKRGLAEGRYADDAKFRLATKPKTTNKKGAHK